MMAGGDSVIELQGVQAEDMQSNPMRASQLPPEKGAFDRPARTPFVNALQWGREFHTCSRSIEPVPGPVFRRVTILH